MIKKFFAGLFAATILTVGMFVTVNASTYSTTPSQVVCTPFGDLRYSVGINWLTSVASTVSKAQVRIQGDSVFTKFYDGTSGQPGSPDTWQWHKIVLNGLEPNTTYEYQVGDGTNWSSINSFTTAPDTDSLGTNGFSFINVNDSQDPISSTHSTWGNTLNRATTKAQGYKFIMHAGDHVDNGSNEGFWQSYFSNAQAVFNKSIFAGASGNHDSGAHSGSTNKYQYRFNYKMPTDSTQSKGTYYSFSYANAHFTVLNSQALDDSRQIDWLKYDVVKNSKKWNVVSIHNPLYTNASHWQEVDARNTFSSILNDLLNVDIVFGGHDHIYNHTYPVLNGAPVKNTQIINGTFAGIEAKNVFVNPTGTVNYVNSTASTKFYDFIPDADQRWFVPITGVGANSPGLQLSKSMFGVVNVTENEILNSAYYVDNNTDNLIETTGIKKDTSQINAPKNVKKTYDANTRRLTINWDEPDLQSGQNVRQYVVYDENNAYQTYWTRFQTGRTITISSLSESVYDKTNFVVKAMGVHTISEAASETSEQEPSLEFTAISGVQKAMLSWTAPAPDAGTSVLAISLDGINWTNLSTTALGGTNDLNNAKLSSALGESTTSAEVVGLKAGIIYYFRLTIAAGANAGSYISNATPASDDGLTGTGNVLIELRNALGVPYLNINDNITADSYIAVKNNTSRPITVPLIFALYDRNNVLIYFRFIPGTTTILEGQTINVMLGSNTIFTSNASYLKVTPYIGSMLPLHPGNTSLVLQKQ